MTIPNLSTIPTRGSAGFGAAFEALLVSMQTGVIPGMNAAVDAVNAAVLAAIGAVAQALVSTSTTSVVIGTGSKSFTVAANRLFQTGQYVLIVSGANSGNNLFGQVTSYNSTSGALVVNVTDTSGAGTLADWTVSIAGIKGAAGAVTSWAGKTGAVAPLYTDITTSSTAVAASNIDLSAGGHFTRTISGATTLTVSNTPTTGKLACFILDLTNGGAFAVTWWASIEWASGVAPTLTAAGRDVLMFFTVDGGATWSGFLVGRDVK